MYLNGREIRSSAHPRCDHQPGKFGNGKGNAHVKGKSRQRSGQFEMDFGSLFVPMYDSIAMVIGSEHCRTNVEGEDNTEKAL